MSSYVELEYPKIVGYENTLADLILANSDETKAKLVSLGLENIHLFQNPAPITFEIERAGEYALFISNHRPHQIMERVADLGIPVRFMGLNDDEFKRVEPEDIARAAFVVCNGKSVQYAMRAGVPVFLFDHFGGNGWEMGEVAEWYNFSGRGVKAADPASLHDWRGQLRGQPCESRFKLEVVLEALGVL